MSELLRGLSILWSLFHILILYMFLYRSRYSRRRTILLTAVCMGFVVIVNTIGMFWYGHEFMAKIFVLTCTIPSMLFFWIISADRKGQFLFTFCLSDTVSLWIIVISNLLDFYLGMERCILMFILRLLAFPLAEWLIWRHLRKIYLELQLYVKKGWLIASVMSAVYYLLVAIMSSHPTLITARPRDLPAFLLVLILMPLTYAAILFSLYQQLVIFRTRERDRMLVIQKEQLEAKLNDYESIRRLKHDMSAFRATLAGLLENQKYDEARRLVSEITRRSDEPPCNYCGDPYVNATLNQYRLLYQEKDIPLKITVQTGSLSLPGMEMSLILSNALDNSLRAVSDLSVEKLSIAHELSGERPQDTEPLPRAAKPSVREMRTVSVQLREKGAYLLLRVRNACAPSYQTPQKDLPPSTKNDPGHGYGLTAIRQTARALGGDMTCLGRDGQFVLDVYVKTPAQAP